MNPSAVGLFLISFSGIVTGFLRGPKPFTVLPGSRCTGNSYQTSLNSCIDCQCEKNRTVCYKSECPQIKLPDSQDCKLVYLPGQCCPSYECPTVTTFVNAQSSDDPNCGSSDPCKKCTCAKGISKCDSYECLEAPMIRPGCRPVRKPNQCCPDYQCVHQEKPIEENVIQTSCSGIKCLLPDNVPDSCKITIIPGLCCPQVDCSSPALPGEDFYIEVEISDSLPSRGKCSGKGRIPSTDLCNVCFCDNGKKKCTQVKCPEEQLPHGCKQIKVDGECCPRLECGMTQNPKGIEDCQVDGPIVSDNPCSQCNCRNGWKTCTRVSCNNVALLPGCQEVRVENKCCPEVRCEEQSLTGMVVEDSLDFHPGMTQNPKGREDCQVDGPIVTNNPCSQCNCRNGWKTCTRVSCNNVALLPGCQEVHVENKCCPEVRCEEQSLSGTNVDDYEDFQPVCLGSGNIETYNPCQVCVCKNGRRFCTKQSCSPVPKTCKAFKVPGKCCPEIFCT